MTNKINEEIDDKIDAIIDGADLVFSATYEDIPTFGHLASLPEPFTSWELFTGFNSFEESPLNTERFYVNAYSAEHLEDEITIEFTFDDDGTPHYINHVEVDAVVKDEDARETFYLLAERILSTHMTIVFMHGNVS